MSDFCQLLNAEGGPEILPREDQQSAAAIQAALVLCRFETACGLGDFLSSASMPKRLCLSISSANGGFLADTARESRTVPTMWLKSEIALKLRHRGYASEFDAARLAN
jgi:hypothetical protein